MDYVESKILGVLKRLVEDLHDLHLIKDKDSKILSLYTSPARWNPQRMDSNIKLTVDEETFRKMQQYGFIFLDHVRQENPDIYVYRPSFTGQIIVSSQSRMKENTVSKTALNILSLMLKGYSLHVEERHINIRKKRIYIGVADIKVRTETFRVLLSEGWIEPANPIIQEDALRIWRHTWRLSAEGQEVLSKLETIDLEAEKAFLDRFTIALAEEIVELIQKRINENPETQEHFEFGDLIQEISTIYKNQLALQK
jgi:hypothetical protein